MNKKKIILILAITLSIIVVGYLIVSKLAYMGWKDGSVVNGEEIVKSSLGDEFLIQYVTRNFPDYETDVSIMDVSKKNKLTFYHNEGDFLMPKIIVQIDSPSLRCYEIGDCIIYRKGTYNFRGINTLLQTSPSDLIHNEQTKEFVDVAKALVDSKQWKWIKTCGRLLLSANDSDVKKTLERYASGEFTQEELDMNKSSVIKKEDMQAYAKKILEE